MTGLPALSGASGERLVLPAWPRDGGLPAWRRRVAPTLAVLALSVLTVLHQGGAIGGPGARPAVTAPGREASPRAGPAGTERSPAPARRGASSVASTGRPASGRVVPPTHARALFAQHSWLVVRPLPPPAPPPPPPPPTAPPFPYTFVGSYAPEGAAPVYFLARGDRVTDAHVGDRLDGVYQFESAANGQLVFVYLPLDVRQTVAAGATK